MALEQLKIKEIVRQAVGKNVDIPEFQREFVWDPEQVKLLAESLFRDYPVGSFLLWDSHNYQEAKTAQGSQASFWIVDGQQRTTALCLLLGMKPFWWDSAEEWNKALVRYDVMVNLLPEEGEDSFEFALPNPIRRRDPRWLPVRQVLAKEKVEDLTLLAQEVAGKITSEQNQSMALFGRVHARLQTLWQIREKDIPVIKISHEVEDVAEIFARLNQAGTRVKEADVILALAAVRNPGWVRGDYLPFRNDLEEKGWDLDAGIFIRTMTGIGHGRARLIEVPKHFWNPDNLTSVWKKGKTVIEDVRKRLAEFGIFSPELLPSTNSLIPFFVLHHQSSTWPDYNFKKAFHWFLIANRDGRYSVSQITSLNEDVRAITEAGSFSDALENLMKRLRVSQVEEAEFLSRYERAGSRFLRLMLYLILFGRQARDWVDETRLGYDKTGATIVAGFEPQWHHIYPRSVLRKNEYPDDKVNALANITVLNERTNVNKLSGKEPLDYIKKFSITSEALRTHVIPGAYIQAREADESVFKWQWDVKNYESFIAQRTLLLAQEANRFLNELAE